MIDLSLEALQAASDKWREMQANGFPGFSEAEQKFAAEALYMQLGLGQTIGLLCKLFVAAQDAGDQEAAEGWSNIILWVDEFAMTVKARVTVH